MFKLLTIQKWKSRYTNNKTEAICKKHNIKKVRRADGNIRCRKCSLTWTTEKKKRNIEKLREIHGGKCTVCGYSKCADALQFHHIEPKNKKFTIAFGASRGYAFNRLVEEAKKCKLVCNRCHVELEAGLPRIGKGPDL